MPRTVSDTPLLTPALRAIARLLLRMTGWRLEPGEAALPVKAVIIAAPHTSNWDMPYTLLAGLALGLHLRWMGKASIFRAPFGPLMRWLGGVAVQRGQTNNLVAESARALRETAGPMQLVVAPEGTRGRTRHWKTGFYFIALQAEVPVVLAYLDYGRKAAGLGPLVRPSGDVERDMAEIRRFYANVQGRRPDLFDPG
jgi:1-acyl-sn-glycerol-3-phosphate acyltransferase